MSHIIAIAEDDDILRETYEAMLPRAVPDTKIETFPEGDSLVERVRKGGVSLVFTDHDMPPGSNGITAIRRIREYDANLPVYLMSANKDALDMAIKAGATGTIDKRDDNAPKLMKGIAIQYCK